MPQGFNDDPLQPFVQPMPDEVPAVDIEQLLMQMILNSSEVTSKRIKFVETQGIDVLSEVTESTRLDPATGQNVNSEEQIIHANALDDGTPMNELGILRCPNCDSLGHESNTSRCLCGRIVCISEGCARWSRRRGMWFCSRWHRFLGWFGINLR